MMGRLWQWVEDNVYAALTRGTQRWVNDMNAPCAEGERPTLQLSFRAAEEAVPAKKRRAE